MTRTAHLILHPEPDAAERDLSWLYRAVDAAERAAFVAVAAPHPGAHIPAESSTLLAALAARTSRIGLIAQVSPQYVAPYNQARMLNTLDSFSEGRAGWRLVTAAEDASPELHPPTTPSSVRYQRAAELVSVLHGLWESWLPGAVVADPETGVYVDHSRLQPVDYAGEFFRVAGPLNLPRSPQVHPPLFVAVDSQAAASFATAHADVAVTTGTRDDLAGVPVVLREIHPDLTDPANLADQLADAVQEGRLDGYVLHLSADGIETFTAEVVPRLRDRGLTFDHYETTTLSGHLGVTAATVGATV